MPTPPLSHSTRPPTTELLDGLEDLSLARRYLPSTGVLDTHRGRPEPQIVAASAYGGCWRFTHRLTFEDAFGWTAPTDVDAVCVLTTVASISRLEPDSPDYRAPERPADLDAEGSAEPDRTDLLPFDLGNAAVRLVGAVDRDGTVVSRLRFADGVYDRQPCGGRLLDVMLRCLDLPTPPPRCGTKRLLASIWLGDILDSYAMRGRKRLSWRDAVARHPLARRARPGWVSKLDDDGLAALAAADDPPPLSWRALRLETMCWGNLAELFPGEQGRLAGWMDDGAYARWVLGQLADPLCTWPWVHEALTPQARHRVSDALSRLLGLGEQQADG